MADKHDDKVEKATGDLTVMFWDIGSTLLETAVPYGSAVSKSFKLYSEIKARRFSKKLIAFMREPNKIDEKTKQQFEERLKDKEDFMEELLDSIDSIENEKKSTMLGKTFAALVENLISSNDFKFMSNAIKTSMTEELEFYIKTVGHSFGKSSLEHMRTLERLGAAGLLHRVDKIDHERAEMMKQRGFTGNPQIQVNFERSKIGIAFANIMNNTIKELKGALGSSNRIEIDQHIIVNGTLR